MIRSIVWQKENDKNQAFQFLLRFSSRNVNTWLKMLVSLFSWKSLETLVVREFVQVSIFLQLSQMTNQIFIIIAAQSSLIYLAPNF